MQGYYKEGTEMSVNAGRRIGVIGAWIERAMRVLGPVVLPDGGKLDRVIETWIPKKRIQAVNPKYGLWPPCLSSRTISLTCARWLLASLHIGDTQLGAPGKGMLIFQCNLHKIPVHPLA